MRMHTLLTKAASIAVCFGIFLSGPVSAFANNKAIMARDVELSADGTLHGQVLNAEGQFVENAQVELRFQGTTVARTATTQDGRFEIGGVRGGAHDLTVGSVATPVRLWKTGTAPQGAVSDVVISASEHVVRGQAMDQYGNPCNTCPPTSGFGLIDVVTLAMLATSVTALVIAIDTNNEVDDLAGLIPASP